MNLEQFYDADPRRRASAEVEFGTQWEDGSGSGAYFGLSWIADTGELYLMAEPLEEPVVDPFGDVFASPTRDLDLGVEVLAVIESQDDLMSVLEGWQDAEVSDRGLVWLRGRISERSPGSN